MTGSGLSRGDGRQEGTGAHSRSTGEVLVRWRSSCSVGLGPLSLAPSLSSMAVQDLGTSRIRSVAEGQFELK